MTVLGGEGRGRCASKSEVGGRKWEGGSGRVRVDFVSGRERAAIFELQPLAGSRVEFPLKTRQNPLTLL